MNDESTSNDKAARLGMTAEQWQRHDNKTDEEILAAAVSDPDAQPLSPEQLASRKPRPLCKIIRNKLRMTRAGFAAKYKIPIEALETWERHEAEPTATETTYLKLIEKHPEIADLNEAAE